MRCNSKGDKYQTYPQLSYDVVILCRIIRHMQLNTLFLNWLHARKITDKVISEFGLSLKEDGRLVIPVCDVHGTFLFNKYRRSPLSEDGPKYTYDKGGKLTLYGADKIHNEDSVLICEGEMDALVAWSANVPAVSGTGGAMSFSAEWVEMFKGKDVTLCFDNDPAGGEGMAKAFDLFPMGSVKVLFIPDKPGVKDISDYVSQGGNINGLLKTARTYNSEEDIRSDMAERESVWQSVYFHTAWIKNHTKPERVVRARDTGMGTNIERAKGVLLTELLSFNGGGNALCPFHSETEGSLHYYKDNNKAWCFGGCGRGYDAIDIVMKQEGVGFKEAVERLNREMK